MANFIASNNYKKKVSGKGYSKNPHVADNNW